MTRHKHAEIIKAWADGAKIEFFDDVCRSWLPTPKSPAWDENTLYRIKPKSDVVRYVWATKKMGGGEICFTEANGPNLKLVFDAETGKLKGAELI